MPTTRASSAGSSGSTRASSTKMPYTCHQRKPQKSALWCCLGSDSVGGIKKAAGDNALSTSPRGLLGALKQFGSFRSMIRLTSGSEHGTSQAKPRFFAQRTTGRPKLSRTLTYYDICGIGVPLSVPSCQPF